MARLHLDKLGAKLTRLSQEQADYIGVSVDGPMQAGALLPLQDVRHPGSRFESEALSSIPEPWTRQNREPRERVVRSPGVLGFERPRCGASAWRRAGDAGASEPKDRGGAGG